MNLETLKLNVQVRLNRKVDERNQASKDDDAQKAIRLCEAVDAFGLCLEWIEEHEKEIRERMDELEAKLEQGPNAWERLELGTLERVLSGQEKKEFCHRWIKDKGDTVEVCAREKGHAGECDQFIREVSSAPKEKRRFTVDDLRKLSNALDVFNLGEDARYFAFLEDEEFVQRALGEILTDPDKVLTLEHIEGLMKAVEKKKEVSREEKDSRYNPKCNECLDEGFFCGSVLHVEKLAEEPTIITLRRKKNPPSPEKTIKEGLTLITEDGKESHFPFNKDAPTAHIRVGTDPMFSLSEFADIMEKIRRCESNGDCWEKLAKEGFATIEKDSRGIIKKFHTIDWPRLFRERPDLVENFREELK